MGNTSRSYAGASCTVEQSTHHLQLLTRHLPTLSWYLLLHQELLRQARQHGYFVPIEQRWVVIVWRYPKTYLGDGLTHSWYHYECTSQNCENLEIYIPS